MSVHKYYTNFYIGTSGEKGHLAVK